MSQQKVIILVGASGTGKTTLAEEMVERGVAEKAITNTTRDMRDGEVDGIHYNFKSRDEMVQDYKDGKLLEVPNEHAGNLYAASKEGLVKESGKPVVLILDPNGANSIYKSLKLDANFDPSVVFLAPIPKEVVIDRIRSRGSSDEELQKRMDVFEDEGLWYDKLKGIVNLVIKQDIEKDAADNVDEYIKKIDRVILSKKDRALTNSRKI